LWILVLVAPGDGRSSEPGPRDEVVEVAMRAYRCGRQLGQFDKALLGVIDYSLPSSEPRLWVIDMESERVLFHERVTHGRGSGELLARKFSNRPGSFESSIGVFRTDRPYRGRHGYSLNLRGLEPGFNDQAFARRIVIHGADYATSEHLARFGRLGRSHGCPVVDPRVTQRLIDSMKEGAALVAYYPDSDWLSGSRYLNCDPPMPRPAGRAVRP
jgi:hypothetical protein